MSPSKLRKSQDWKTIRSKHEHRRKKMEKRARKFLKGCKDLAERC